MAEKNIYSLSLSRLGKHSDIIVATGIIGILLVMILPLPTPILDLLLAFNITLALMTLLVAVYTIRPLEFSIFPTLLLILTLFRLSLNVSSTRLILLYGDRGPSAAGEVIRSFGSFVVGGNFVVGIIVFSILVLINFVVITSGASRIAEVGARFTLDAMPGKQMAIDADLNAGTINEQEARTRRQNIQQEADFYGSMDGASKFVRGDAIAGILITLVNAIGGMIIGILQQGMALRDALQSYTVLTVGDGLVSQVPALIISSAAGIVVTKASAEYSIGEQIKHQFLLHPRAMGTVSGILLLLGIIPGLPQFPLLSLAIITGVTAFYLVREQQSQRQHDEDVTPQQTDESETGFDPSQALAPIDILELEVGYSLIPLVDSGQKGDLLERIKAIRQQIAQELGVVVPPLRIRDNLQLKSGGYIILIKGTQVANGELMTEHYLAMHPGGDAQEIIGVPTTDPAFGLAAYWIEEAQKEQAQFAGYTVVDPTTVIVTHLTEVIKRHIHELLNREDVQKLLDRFAQEYPKVVEELVPNQLTLGGVQKVLQNLLREQISIRDLLTILESLADHAPLSKDPLILTEHVRQSLSRAITHKWLSESGELPVLVLSFELEETLSKSLQQTEHGTYLAIDPQITQRLISELTKSIEQFSLVQHHTPILLTSPMVRPHLRRLTEAVLPQLVVLSQSEIISTISIKNLGVVRI